MSWALSSSSVLDTPHRGPHKGTLVLRKGVKSPLLTQRDGGEGEGGRKGEEQQGVLNKQVYFRLIFNLCK